MLIRPGTSSDFAAMRDLAAVVRPYAVVPAGQQRQYLEKLLADERSTTVAAEHEDRLIGWSTLTPAVWDEGPDVYRLTLLVHPEHRRRGVGSALLAAADEWLGRVRVSKVDAFADEHGLPFALRHGFAAGAELTYSGLDLTDPPTGFAVPAGLAVVPFSDLTADDVYPAYRATCLDIPGGSAIDPPLDWFRHELWGTHDPHLSLALVEQGVVVAFTLSVRDSAALWTDMTGTLATHRGRGLGLAVKTETFRRAAEAGVTRAYTINNVGNPAILAVNERLGYRPVGRRVHVTREY